MRPSFKASQKKREKCFETLSMNLIRMETEVSAPRKGLFIVFQVILTSQSFVVAICLGGWLLVIIHRYI